MSLCVYTVLNLENAEVWRGLAGWRGDADGLAGRAWNGPNWPCFGPVREWENNMVNSHWHSVHQSAGGCRKRHTQCHTHVDSEHTANMHIHHRHLLFRDIGMWVD